MFLKLEHFAFIIAITNYACVRLVLVLQCHITAVVQMWRVVDFCCQYLEQEVTEDNYLYLQELALLYSLERLNTFIDHFILARFATLSFTPDFLRDIPVHKLTFYLSTGQVLYVVYV